MFEIYFLIGLFIGYYIDDVLMFFGKIGRFKFLHKDSRIAFGFAVSASPKFDILILFYKYKLAVFGRVR